MTEATYGRSAVREIKKPKCAACGVEMWLLQIEPQLAADLCTFECARCGATEKSEVAPGRGMANNPTSP